MYIDRRYREDINNELNTFEIQVKDTDLSVSLLPNQGIDIDDLKERLFQFIFERRRELEEFILTEPEFQTSLQPLMLQGTVPASALAMAQAANR
ncbi:MAG: hypothetical protein U0M15_02195, partial [Bacillota bacterium]|nr:hypothetical protein [Bacillota bacterium]